MSQNVSSTVLPITRMKRSRPAEMRHPGSQGFAIISTPNVLSPLRSFGIDPGDPFNYHEGFDVVGHRTASLAGPSLTADPSFSTVPFHSSKPTFTQQWGFSLAI
jgi:hypothetical protein